MTSNINVKNRPGRAEMLELLRQRAEGKMPEVLPTDSIPPATCVLFF